ncbi:hypothetical protein LX36DRAFT_287202 [Colletotrichum falcatum]|nr:hypothetical protein LX36DRAFT_287202 [Colletotrichum falcatum]
MTGSKILSDLFSWLWWIRLAHPKGFSTEVCPKASRLRSYVVVRSLHTGKKKLGLKTLSGPDLLNLVARTDAVAHRSGKQDSLPSHTSLDPDNRPTDRADKPLIGRTQPGVNAGQQGCLSALSMKTCLAGASWTCTV